MTFQVPVSPFTYVYIIFAISGALCSALAAYRRQEDHSAAFLLCAALSMIGCFSNINLVSLSW